MGFKNLLKRQKEMKNKLTLENNPIYDFKRYNKTIKLRTNLIQPVVFTILDKDDKILYVGRATRNLHEAFSRMSKIDKSVTLELYNFTREDAAISFARRLIHFYNPEFNRFDKVFTVIFDFGDYL